MSASIPASSAEVQLVIPAELPFLESLSWFDTSWRELSPLEILKRYESGWRHRGVTAELSTGEAMFVRTLILRFGSFLDVPA